MNLARPPIFPLSTAGRTLRVRPSKGTLRHPVTGRAGSDLSKAGRSAVESPDWTFQ